MPKCINHWWFPDNDIGPSTWADCEWGEPVLNAQMFPIIEEAFQNRQCQHAIDVGANIGYVTSWLSKRWNKVTSFEPTPTTFECLERNCTKPNIRLHNRGISDNNGHLCFAVSDQKPDQNQFITDTSKLRKRWDYMEIPVARLDRYGFNCDFIKIDVEGHEYQAIQGALSTIARCRPAIMIEISYEGKLLDHDITANHKDTIKVIEELGYKTAWQCKHDWFMLPLEW